MILRVASPAILIFASWIGAGAVQAAVRTCLPVVSSEISIAPTPLDAKKKALDQWREKARRSGAGFDNWRLAANKSLMCFPKKSDTQCVAIGQPCTINQVPKRLRPSRSLKSIGI